MQNPNDFHPTLSFDKHMQDSIDLAPDSRQMKKLPLERNSRKLQEYNESLANQSDSGSQTPPGNDDQELGQDVASIMQVTAINFITNQDFQEKHENELTVNDDVEDDEQYIAQEPDFNLSEINKYLEKG